MSLSKPRLEFSAGGVLYKRERNKLIVVLIVTKDGTVYSLPKGLIEKGEKPEEAALREIEEETGCKGRIEGFLGKVEYWYVINNQRIHKFVYYYLVEYISGNTKYHDWEVEKAEWFEIEEAIKRVSFKNEREIIQRAFDRITGRNP